MQRLIDGISRFHREVYPRHRERFRSLAAGQSPETLFITCSDSRIVPDLVLDTGPGELFVSRNAGNIVLPHGDGPSGESATIEYAVEVLGVTDVVICGHSDCGAMRAVMRPDSLGSLNAVAAWLQFAAQPDAVNDSAVDERVSLRALIEKNVLTQIANLRTHPCVTKKAKHRKLEIHGWVFDIESATFSAFDPSDQAFVPLPRKSGLGPAFREVSHA